MTEASTQTVLLDAAESAFAEHGVDNVSLRSIMRGAGVNPAAVHYHYGSREELARAVLLRVLEPLQERRLELLEIAVANEGSPSLRRLLDAVIRPDLEMVVAIGTRNPDAARLPGAIYTRPSDFVKTLVEASFKPVALRFMPHIQAALPDHHPDELSWRIRWSVFGLLGALLSDEPGITHQTLESDLDRVLAVTVGALTAPPTMEPKK
jgi:AcrR family transcriptional regulator